jgi:hypothetical protein
VEHTTRDSVERTIFSRIHEKQYTLAGEAPICNGELFQDFGYCTNTPASRAVLDGTYIAPTTLDAATRELFAEIATIRRLVPENSVTIIITQEQWKQYWKVISIETSSSESGIHFGHYIVGSKSDIISRYHSACVLVILAHAIKLKRWSRGLSVMLEKTLGVTLVTKLCTILLMEGDFNATNKIVYRLRMLQNARNHNFMPEKIFRKKNRMVDDSMLCKTLFFDIARQTRIPAAIALVDVSNCYDRITHAMASLVFQAFGVPTTAIESMLGAIENIKFFLRTGFGDSATFSGSGISIKTQGLCQGNRATLARWAVISFCIIGTHKKKDHGAKFLCPITQLQHHLSAVLYISNTNLLHINLKNHESIDEVHLAIQESVNSWGDLLIVTGGALQPAKCFFSIISFGWKNGNWSYESNTSKQKLGITVPLPGGGRASIDHKLVEHAEKTLGVMTSPNGNSDSAIEMMQEKAQQWINAVRNGHLHRCNVWFSLKVHWPRIGYGFCSSTATLEGWTGLSTVSTIRSYPSAE